MTKKFPLLLFFGVSAAIICVAPFWGTEWIPFRALWNGSGDAAQFEILWKLRIPRTAMAFLAGAGLATCGMAFQALFRNPLATPFTLGISSGASLGAAICLQTGFIFSFFGYSGVTIAAFCGAVLTILLVYGLTTRVPEGSSNATLLLAGVAVSFFFSSLILFLQYMSDPTRTFRMLRWVMGGVESVVGASEVFVVLPFVAGGSLIVAYLLHELNLLLLGDDFAAGRGVDLRRTKILLYFAVSMMVGAIVAFCGPIGFVGLIVPHACRLTIGSDHRRLFPAVWIIGGAFLVLCDAVGRTILTSAELPVGVITSLLGGPFFLWLLFGRKSGYREFG